MKTILLFNLYTKLQKCFFPLRTIHKCVFSIVNSLPFAPKLHFPVHCTSTVWLVLLFASQQPGSSSSWSILGSQKYINKTQVLFEMMWHFHINWNENIVLPLICLCETEPSSEILWCLMFYWGFESDGQLVVRWTNVWNSPERCDEQHAETSQPTHTGAWDANGMKHKPARCVRDDGGFVFSC